MDKMLESENKELTYVHRYLDNVEIDLLSILLLKYLVELHQ